MLLIITVVGLLYMVYLRPFITKMKVTEIIRVNNHLTFITGGGGNSGIITSDSLIVVIDTKMDEASENLHKEVMSMAGKRKVIVINTHWHPDHIGGNALYKNAQIIAGGSYTPESWESEAGLESMPNVWVKDQLMIPMGGDTLTVFNLKGNVHTPSDVMVYLHQQKVLFGGDVILNKQVPILLDKANPYAYSDVLQTLPLTYDIKIVVPGHGDIGGPEIISTFAQYFTDMYTAATHPEQEEALVKKYRDWNQIPFFMSPAATISLFKKYKK